VTITLTEYESPFSLSRSFPKKQQMAASIQPSAYTFALALVTDIIHFYIRNFLHFPDGLLWCYLMPELWFTALIFETLNNWPKLWGITAQQLYILNLGEGGSKVPSILYCGCRSSEWL